MIGQCQPDSRHAVDKIICKLEAQALNWALVGLSKAERDIIVAALSSDEAVAAREPALVTEWRAEARKHTAAALEVDCDISEDEWYLHRESARIYELCANQLAALPSEAIGREWQPISTAPKDGTVVLIFCQYSSGSPEIKIGHWTPPVGKAGQYGHFVWQTEDKGQSFAEQIVTHWMPLPDGPVVTRPQSGGAA